MTEKLPVDLLRGAPAVRIKQRLRAAGNLIDSRYGYYRLKDDDSTRLPEESPTYEETQKYGNELDAYFRYRIDYYPYFKDKPSWLYPFGWKYFVLINEEMIEGKFPRDHDVRTVITAYRLANTYNQRLNIVGKRIAQGLYSAALFVPAIAATWSMAHPDSGPAWLLPSDSPLQYWLTLSIYVAVLTFFYVVFLRTTSARVRDATQSNARDLSGKIQHRLNNLKQNYTEFMKNIATVQFSGLDMDSTEWTTRAKWWAMLALWVPKRIEYIEKFLQSEMQRMRIFLLWSDIAGNLSSLLLWAAVCVAAFLTSSFFGHKPDAALHSGSAFGWMLFAGAVVLTFVAALYSMAGHASISVESISKWIGDREWGRFSDIGLHEEFGEVIRQGKEQIRQDSMQGGYGSGSGGGNVKGGGGNNKGGSKE